jgi:hypothetical protein
MSRWSNLTRCTIEFLHDYNTSAMIRAGFQPDPGRALTPEEIAQLSLTPPERIRDCGYKSKYHWR